MQSRLNSLRRARPLLGTLVDIRANGDEHIVAMAISAAFDEIEQIQKIMSFHEPQSDVSRLNRDACRRPVQVDPRTWEVLAAANAVSEASDGAFDITVAPKLVSWDYLPNDFARLPTVRHNGYRRIELLPDNCVSFLETALIDLGGIAKGYAVDRACLKLEQMGIVDYVVNAGGDLRVGITPEPIHVRHPYAPGEFVLVATLSNAAVATSATYFSEKQSHGTTVHPLVSPKNSAPVPMPGSVSVLAENCMTSDALTKVVAILGENASSVLARFSAQACLLPGRGDRKILPAIEDAEYSTHIGIP